MICVLKVVQGPAAGRQCWLRRDQRVTIGRLTTADFSVAADAHMSRNHLIVEGLSNSFRLRDVGSSNGTFVNDLPISVVELCTGDRIKAGTSVFEVALELGDEDTPAAADSNGDLFASIPTRTLSSHELHDAIEEVTVRYSSTEDAGQEELSLHAETQQLAQFGGEKLVASPAVPECPSNSPSSGRVPAWPLPTPFSNEFKPNADGLRWHQASTGDRLASQSILDVLLEHSPNAQYSLIVNRTQVEGAERGALDFLLSTRESRLLTETLCVIESPKPENIIEIYKRCLGKDAAILIASAGPLSSEWLLDAIDTLSYPSLLADVLNREPKRAEQMSQFVHFMLYEARSHELSLLVSK